MVEYTSEMQINGYIKAEFLKKDSESNMCDLIKLTDLNTGSVIKFHHTTLKLLKQLLKNREL